MRKLIVLFSCEAINDGSILGQEMRERVKALITHMRKDLHTEAFIAQQTIGFSGRNRYSELIKKELVGAGLKSERIHSKGYAVTTLEEIAQAEIFLSKNSDIVNVIAVTTWYHTVRVRCLWWWHYGRCVKTFAVHYYHPYTWYRALLEPLKFLLALTPTCVQSMASEKGRKIGVLK
jgi:hypothetical protein